ncbi:MAG: hypothetical protein KDF58_01360 [Alphaproteobacteria bacterium]|nr:hypothetical protein [Alphaproteobacteria bacterium]HPF47131.1 hypothetical protein [Emcibacteraceae bacterium]HRW30818.1 hypothetical protein [Emcibacteraceae bacterium]
MQITEHHIIGAKNLLNNCAGLKKGESLLIISERSDLGWYDGKTARFISEEAEKMGINPTTIVVGRPENVRCPKLHSQIENHDCTIFFSRIGDQDRFSRPKPGTRSVMCYIRDMDMLASPFGTTPYQAIRDLKDAVDDILIHAKDIDISCPLGTDFSGSLDKNKKPKHKDVGVLRFPLGVPAPIEAENFSGRIVMDRYLAPTGSSVYEPPFVKIDEPIFAEIKEGRIINFTGPKNEVEKVKAHYQNVATGFNIDPAIVHSWHAGIHPGCTYTVPESENPDRWSNTVFNDPNYVHFHTCGDYAPGEISCTLPGHSIKVNGTPLWQDGKLLPHMFEKTSQCIGKWPELASLFNYSAA